MDEIANEYPEEVWLQPAEDERLEDIEFQPWHGMYFRAFDALQHDRFYGSHGWQSAIYYTALSRYASDHGIVGDDFCNFLTFMNAIDAEHLAISAEDLKAAIEHDKGKPNG